MIMPQETADTRGHPGHGALHSTPSLIRNSSSMRSSSPHISPDRITRSVSASQHEADLVPRIPQPYRTSFSAVTSPRRIHWSADNVLDQDSSSENHHDNIDSEFRTKSEDLLSQAGFEEARDSYHAPRSAVSADSMLSEEDPLGCNHSNSSSQFQRHSPRYASTPGRIYGVKRPSDPQLVNGDCGPRTGDSVISDNSVFSDRIAKADELVREFMGTSAPDINSVQKSHINTKQGLVKPHISNSQSTEDTVKIKQFITKEYVHIASVDYLKKYKDNLPPANSETDLVVDDMLRDKKKKAVTSKSTKQSQPKIRGNRSKISSEADILATPPPGSIKRSLSVSIGSLFKKMSPNSIRRSFRLKGKSKSQSSSVNCDDSPSTSREKVPLETSKRIEEITHQLQKLTQAHNENADPAQHSGSSSTTSNPSPLPSSSARILRAMQPPAQSEQSVYHSFKAKQSPRLRSTETVALKPQALKAVEFPDNITDSLSPPPKTASQHLSLHPSFSQSHKQNGVKSVSKKPGSLEVQQVSQLDKGAFQFPRLSMESIGQCSLDVGSVHEGSEPSLTTNGLKPHTNSSVTASKRTLTSQENISPSQPIASPQDALTSTHRKPSSDGNTDITASENSPKTPSYLKLSCAVSGYNNYNSYNNAPRLSTRKKEDKTDSPITDSTQDQENIVPNGDIDHGVKVHKVKVAPAAKDNCESVNSSTNSSASHLNGAILSNSAVVCNFTVDDMPPYSNPVTPSRDTVTVSHGSVTDSGLDTPDSSRLMKQTPVKNQSNQEAFISTPANDKPADSQVPTPQKDGRYFQGVMEREAERLGGLCDRAEQDLMSGRVPDEVSGKLRAAIGKANLLITKKFKQFRGLCEKNLDQGDDEPFQTTCQDLAGFWDMVLLQVEDISDMFDDIERLRRSGWKGLTLSNSKLYAVNTPKAKQTNVRVKSGKTKPSSSVTPATPKSAKQSEAAKQREEARKRLIAAKRAGRQRKESQNDTEVEIFIPQ